MRPRPRDRFQQHRFRQPRPLVDLAARLDASQPVQRQPADDGGQEGLRIVHLGSIGRRPAEPSILQNVLSIRYRTENSVTDTQQPSAMLLEDQRTILISIAFDRFLAHGPIPLVVGEATGFRIIPQIPTLSHRSL